jgi:hypothetical protein
MPILDHPHSKVPELLEIVRGIIDVAPVESEPLDVVEDVVNILCVLLGGVGIVKTEVTHPVVVFCYTKVHADGFGMSDMKITVRLRRETRLDASVVFAFGEVFLHELFYKTQAAFLLAYVILLIVHNFKSLYLFINIDCKVKQFLLIISCHSAIFVFSKS